MNTPPLDSHGSHNGEMPASSNFVTFRGGFTANSATVVDCFNLEAKGVQVDWPETADGSASWPARP